MQTLSCEDFCIHLGIKGDAGAQHMQRDEVYPGIASDHRKGGFSHTHQYLRHDDVANTECSELA